MKKYSEGRDLKKKGAPGNNYCASRSLKFNR